MPTVRDIRRWPKDSMGWRVGPSGLRVKLGNGVRLGDWVTLGNGVILGNWVTLGNGVILGNGVTLGNGVILGNWVTLGNGVILGDGVRLGNGVILGNGVKLGDGVEFQSSPLQIRGSRHLCHWFDNKGALRIGCEVYPVKDWVKNFKKIGAEHEYTPAQIKEYKEYIDVFAKRKKG